MQLQSTSALDTIPLFRLCLAIETDISFAVCCLHLLGGIIFLFWSYARYMWYLCSLFFVFFLWIFFKSVNYKSIELLEYNIKGVLLF